MFTQIIHNTPLWVWVLLTALVALGYSQTRHRSVGLQRLLVIPMIMIFLSLFGTVSAFGPSPAVLGAWLAACAMVISFMTVRPAPSGAAYDCTLRRYAVPGS